MKLQTKLAIRRVAIRWARKLLDFLDERLHTEETALREEIASREALRERGRTGTVEKYTASTRSVGTVASLPRVTFAEWEMRRSGVAVISKKEARRRQRPSASAFDLRFAR